MKATRRQPRIEARPRGPGEAAEMPEVNRHIDAATLRQLELPDQYLGSAEQFRKSLLSLSQKPVNKKEQ